jgi:DNA-directed RNA polymerase subunit RPC12/RpoP
VAKYKNETIIEASQWFKNGDHPLDGDDPSIEGKVVRYYRVPTDNDYRCSFCKEPISKHGWIDQEDDYIVCPGDWIITDPKGGYVPMNNELFRKTYTEISAEEVLTFQIADLAKDFVKRNKELFFKIIDDDNKNVAEISKRIIEENKEALEKLAKL